jgi:uncharacterized protein YkwD
MPRSALTTFRAPLIAAVLALMAAAGTLGAPAGHAHALTNCTVSDSSLDAEEQSFLTLINNYRAQNNAGALGASTNLNRAAEWLSEDMSARAYFSHTDSLGRDPSTRAVDCGYPSGAGENIAAGTAWDTALEVFNAWKASPGHNGNMLNSSYKQIGIARFYRAGSPYSWYWTTDFGLDNDGTSGGAAPPPSTIAKAAMSSPALGSTLPGAATTFTWTAGSGALQYSLWVGRSAGASDLHSGFVGSSRSQLVSGLPTDGSTVYVRLRTQFSTGWQYTDYTYRASAGATSTPVAGTKAAMTSPAGGSTIRGGSATFRWTSATGALKYRVYVGTTRGGSDLYLGTATTALNATIRGLPTNGRTLYVRLWTKLASGWVYTDYTYGTGP